jgi:hypothetical protein
MENNKEQLDLLRFIEQRMDKISNQAYIDDAQLIENLRLSRSTLYEIKYLKTLIEHDILDESIAESLNLILNDVIKNNESQIELSMFIGHINKIIGY